VTAWPGYRSRRLRRSPDDQGGGGDVVDFLPPPGIGRVLEIRTHNKREAPSSAIDGEPVSSLRRKCLDRRAASTSGW